MHGGVVLLVKFRSKPVMKERGREGEREREREREREMIIIIVISTTGPIYIAAEIALLKGDASATPLFLFTSGETD